MSTSPFAFELSLSDAAEQRTQIHRHYLALHAWVAQWTASGLNAADGHLYALIDTGQATAVRTASEQLFGNRFYVQLFENTAQHGLLHLGPWLVAMEASELDTAFDPEVSTVSAHLEHTTTYRTCALAQGHPCVTWIWSSQSTQELAKHLRGLFDGVLIDEEILDRTGDATQAREGEVHLRYYDPRVLQGFMSALLPPQQARVLHGLHSIGMYDRLDTWHQWAAADTPTVQPVEGDLVFSLSQHGEIAQHTQADRLMAALAQTYGKKQYAAETFGDGIQKGLLALRASQQFRVLAPMLDRSRALGLQDDGALMLYASLCVAVHPEFDRHPALQEPLRSVREGKADFITVMSGIDDAVWQSLRQSARSGESSGSPRSFAPLQPIQALHPFSSS